MGDDLAKGRFPRELVVHVNGVEVAAEPGEVDQVRLGDRSTQRLPLVAHLDVIEKQVLSGESHGHAPPVECFDPAASVQDSQAVRQGVPEFHSCPLFIQTS